MSVTDAAIRCRITATTFVIGTFIAGCGPMAAMTAAPNGTVVSCDRKARTGFALMPDRGRVAYSVEGCGRPVVLLHSTFMNSRQWDGLTRQLAGSHQVIRYDVGGHGGTPLPRKPRRSFDELGTVLDAIGVERAVLIGSSMGGGIALDFALSHPERVSALMMVGAAPGGARPDPEDGKAIGDIFRVAGKDGIVAGVRKWVDHPINRRANPTTLKEVARIASGSPAIFTATQFPIASISPPAVERLAEVRVPTLIVIGRLDSPGLMRAAQTMATTILGARLEIFEQSAHFPNLDEPDRFHRVVVDFLASQRSPSG